MKDAWRIFEVKDGKPSTLFHGLDGLRNLPLDQHLFACQKLVAQKGSKKPFKAGFHCLFSKQDTIDYLTRFKPTRELAVCRVKIDDLHTKPTNPLVVLAGLMFIKSKDWENRICQQKIF